MALKSKLFAGNARLEAAASLDAQHIKFGDRGDHVRKIQLALNMIDSCGLTTDGIFGPSMQNSVLLFKRARNIVGRGFQASPDAIVGVLTITALDDELWTTKEVANPVVVRVIAPTRTGGPGKQHARDNSPLMLATAFSVRDTGGAPTVGDSDNAPQLSMSGRRLSIKSGQSAVIEILNAKDGVIKLYPGCTARVIDPLTKKPVERIDNDRQSIEIVGGQPQTTKVFIDVPRYLGLKTDRTVLIVVVHDLDETWFEAGMEAHDHRPTKNWPDLLRVIEQPTDDATGKFFSVLCKANAVPRLFATDAMLYLAPYPTAVKHIKWYLSEGHGADYIEDDNIRSWIEKDSNIRKAVATLVRKNMARQRYRFYFGWLPDEDTGKTPYESMDHFNSFGHIDKLFVRFDVVAKTVSIAFKDIYEWHPVCPKYYKKFDDDVVRNTNSMHAAFVELKDAGAADFWMIGQATFDMSKFGLP